MFASALIITQGPLKVKLKPKAEAFGKSIYQSIEIKKVRK